MSKEFRAIGIDREICEKIQALARKRAFVEGRAIPASFILEQAAIEYLERHKEELNENNNETAS